MEQNKVNCNDSGLLRALLDEVASGGELESTMETSVADQSVRYGNTTSNDFVTNPTSEVPLNNDMLHIPGPSGDYNPLPRKRYKYKRPNLARPVGYYDSDVSDTTVDDTDEDKDYCPSETEPSTDYSKPKLGVKQIGLGRGNRRGRGRGFAASTPEKKKPIRLKVSKPKSSVCNNSNIVERPRPTFVEGVDNETGIDLLGLESSDDILSSEEDNVDEPDSDEEEPWYEMRDGDILPGSPVTFMEQVGPKHMPPTDSQPIIYFNLFFTAALITNFVTETNRYATQSISNAIRSGTLKPKSRASEWLPVSFGEMRAFIACILNMGLLRKSTIASYWSTLPCSATPWFGKMFSRNRFQLILKFFHLINNREQAKLPYDPCAKFMPIVEHANVLFRHFYVPHEKLSIDESLIGTKSHTSLLQYLPNKQHHRWGIKLWVLCDSVVNYILAFSVYRGAVTDEEKQNQKELGVSHLVVKKLLQVGNYLNKGYHLFVDNFYTSIPLARYLYDVGTYITGTIRMNRKLLPKEIKQKFDVGQTKFFKNGPLLLCGHRDKKSQKNQVLLLSTKAQNTTTEVERRVRHQTEPEIIKKPDVILQYNKFMGGVDVSDMMIYAYLDERRTIKYWKKVVFNVMSRMVSNLYILYKENIKPTGKKPMTRLQFTESIVNSIGEEWLAYKNTPEPQDPPQAKPLYGIKRLPGNMVRKCYGCSTERLKRSHFVCVKCEKGLHPECIPTHQCKN